MKFDATLDTFVEVDELPTGIDYQDSTSIAILVDTCLFPVGRVTFKEKSYHISSRKKSASSFKVGLHGLQRLVQ